MTEAPFISTDTYAPDLLLAGSNIGPVTDTRTLVSGQNLARGALLGLAYLGTATSAAKSGGNTGNGTLVMDATTPVLANATPGIHTVRIVIAGTNSFTARVTDPKGVVLGDVIVSGSGASGTFTDRIKFAITDGATDFIVGDGFDITVAAGSDKLTKCVATAIDGSQYPYAILADAIDATSGDKLAPVFLAGEFNINSIVADASITLTAAATRDALRALSIYLKTPIAA